MDRLSRQMLGRLMITRPRTFLMNLRRLRPCSTGSGALCVLLLLLGFIALYIWMNGQFGTPQLHSLGEGILRVKITQSNSTKFVISHPTNHARSHVLQLQKHNSTHRHDMRINQTLMTPKHHIKIDQTPIQKSDSNLNVKEFEIHPPPVEEISCAQLKQNKRKYDSPYICLQNDNHSYFTQIAKGTKCIANNTDMPMTFAHPHLCHCQKNWHGEFCSIPDIVYHSNYPHEYGIVIKSPPNRIIYFMPFNNETQLLETKIHELNRVVDVFVILESNFTASGAKKPWYLKALFDSGFLASFHEKILYVQLDRFPIQGYKNGWVADALLRNYMGHYALPRIHGILDSDIIIINDADEIPQKEALQFLRLHYGYTEPFGFSLRHHVFSFKWQGADKLSTLYGGCTYRMLREVYKSELYRLRNALETRHNKDTNLGAYEKLAGKKSREWTFGSEKFPAGWHCSWFGGPELVKHKMLSAHLSDTPRWGSMPEKTDLTYISSIIEGGKWFDGKTSLIHTNKTWLNLVPDFILAHKGSFKACIGDLYSITD